MKKFIDYLEEVQSWVSEDKETIDEVTGLDLANSAASGYLIGTSLVALYELIGALYEQNKNANWLKKLKYKFTGGEIPKEEASKIIKEIQSKIPKEELRSAFNAIMNSPELKNDKNKDFIKKLNASKKNGVFKYEWESAFKGLNKKQIESLRSILLK